jgi:hypothetical protein
MLGRVLRMYVILGSVFGRWVSPPARCTLAVTVPSEVVA